MISRLLAAVLVFSGCAAEQPLPVWQNYACPPGEVLEITLWDVYATPRRPDGRTWDGLDGGDLLCDITATAVRNQVVAALSSTVPGGGELANRFYGEAFEREVAGLCGLVANWLSLGFEGPDMFVLGGFPGEPFAWESNRTEDSWIAEVSETLDGGAPGWDVSCGYTGGIAMRVLDHDLDAHDLVGDLVFRISDITPEMLCNGWAVLPGRDGIAAVLLQVGVADGRDACP